MSMTFFELLSVDQKCWSSLLGLLGNEAGHLGLLGNLQHLETLTAKKLLLKNNFKKNAWAVL